MKYSKCGAIFETEELLYEHLSEKHTIEAFPVKKARTPCAPAFATWL